MYALTDEEYRYIKNKYHNTDVPYNSLGADRFTISEDHLAPETGLSRSQIRDGIIENDKLHISEPHILRKAHAVAYILDSMRIECDPRDLYPALGAMDRPLTKTLIGEWDKDVFDNHLEDTADTIRLLGSTGTATLWVDYDHSVPNFDRIFPLGFYGLWKEAQEARERHLRAGTLDGEAAAFFDAIDIEYGAILRLLSRLRCRALERGHGRMAESLDTLLHGAPQTLYDVLLTEYIYFIICEHIESLQVRSLSNFDRLLCPYYERDLARGVGEEELRHVLAAFLFQFTAIDNYWNQPLYLGGTAEDGSTLINAFSYFFLDVYDKMGIFNPKVQIKYNEKTPKDFTLHALDMIRRGHNCIVFVNEETTVRSLMRYGLSAEDARTIDLKGCYECAPREAYGSVCMCYVNLAKALEFVFFDGADGVSGRQVLPPHGADLSTFEGFFSEYLSRMDEIIGLCTSAIESFAPYLRQINPLILLSSTFSSCLSAGRDALSGGAKNVGGNCMFGFLANAADSLCAIRRLVYESGEYTLAGLADVLKNDFAGEEKLRLCLLHKFPHVGNNDDEPDTLAVRITDHITARLEGKPFPPFAGGSYTTGYHVARMSYIQAGQTMATADGRRRGEELSKNVSPSMGMAKSGPTANILSITKLHSESFRSDATLDLGVHPTVVRGEEGLSALYGLLTVFMKRGGKALHINVFDADTLRAAQKDPEKYEDLQIRVCGWNVKFVNISKEEQDGFIRQAEALS